MHKFTRLQKNLNQFKLSKTLYLNHIAAVRKPDPIFYFITAVQFQSLFLHSSHWCNPAIWSFFFFLKLFILPSWTTSSCHRNREAKLYSQLKVPFPVCLHSTKCIQYSIRIHASDYHLLLVFDSNWAYLQESIKSYQQPCISHTQEAIEQLAPFSFILVCKQRISTLCYREVTLLFRQWCVRQPTKYTVFSSSRFIN